MKKSAIEKKIKDAMIMLMKKFQGGFIMERKRLVSIALMIIMLLNCVLPVFAVDNAEQSNGIQLNLKLYTAIKADLTSQGVEFSSNDVNHTLYISEDVKSTITKLTLNNAGLSNLDVLQNFTALTSLELS